MIKVLWVLLVILAITVSSYAQAAEPGALAPLIPPGIRLMIFSPHPDDETLGAAGLIQRVLREGGKVKVVFMTDGAGFPEGVEREDRISNPTAKDYRNYGDERRGEALMADTRLGLKEGETTFLGFPDGGLSYLLRKYCSGSQAYQSPYTKENCPPPLEIVIPHTVFTGDDLTREVEREIADFRPDVVATTPLKDVHPDHSATYSFVKEALARLSKKDPGLKPRVLTFLVHFGQWPIGQGAGTGSLLHPPEGFPDQGGQWVSLALTPEEAATKRQAIMEYHSQMLVMDRWLLSFARSNELFILENQLSPPEK
ncbi:MAG: PIG-L deacetylase family protein [Desulfobaccales bacterium]